MLTEYIPPPSSPSHDLCYRFVNAPMTAVAAKNACEAEGADLASVETEAEWGAVKEMLDECEGF